VRLIGGKLEPADDFFERVEPVLSRLDRVHDERDDLTFDQFLDRFCGPADVPDREAVMLARGYVEGFNAADATRISSVALRESEEEEQKIQATKLFRLACGYDAVPAEILAGCDPSHVRLRLNTIATNVRWKRGQVEITVRSALSDAALEPIRGSRLIVTLPLGVLQAPPDNVGAARFTPELPRPTRDAIESLAMGSVLKAICLFRASFFEDAPIPTADGKTLADQGFLHGGESCSFQTWWTQRGLRVPILVGWSGGAQTVNLVGKSQEELVGAVIESLSRLLGFPPSRITQELESCHVVDWQSDPFARGAYSYVPVGGLHAIEQLIRPIDDTLYIAGEATHEGLSGTVAGAIASGIRAARQIVNEPAR
jgi:monoamine oxidase